ncbi:Ger(x)C family spore germination protein [Inediibacterium massiliense]|uniref:Ger(x)C family spore germination protein n=1 Tax=Inediibacterium massiliense TaxID=1658111 RepID=UPI0006B445BD|nr:Ger(x)C family spore germination protein [Inediibacterium massiliense]
MKKIMGVILSIIFLSGCWNYREINNTSIAAGLAVDYDKNKKQVILNAEIIYPTIAGGETTLKSQIVRGEGRNSFDAIRNMIQTTGKKIFWAHAKIIVIGEEAAKNEKVLISLIDFAKRDAEARDDLWVLVSKEKTAEEILTMNPLIQDISSFQIEDILKNEKGISKYVATPLWKFVDDLSSEGISPVLPTASTNIFEGKKIVEIYGTEVFKKAKPVGWLNGNETKSLLFVLDKLKGGALVIDQKQEKSYQKIALEILKNKTKIEPIDKDGQIIINISTKTTVNINDLESKINFMDKKIMSEIQKTAEKKIEEDIQKVVEKVQKEYNSDIFGFSQSIERKYPKLWTEMKPNWDRVFKNLKVNVHSDVLIRGSALRSKPIEVKK